MTDKISYREITWAIRDNFDPQLNPIDRHILILSASCINKDHQFQWSYTSLAHASGWSRRSVGSSLRKLLILGYFILIKKGSNLGSQPNLYQLSTTKITAMSGRSSSKHSARGALCSPQHSARGALHIVHVVPQDSAPRAPLESVKDVVKNGAPCPKAGGAPLGTAQGHLTPEQIKIKYAEQFNRKK